MKQTCILMLFVSLLVAGFEGKSQKSTSGYILFGKNKTEGNIVCSQQGICKLQQIEEADLIPVTFTATPLFDSSSDYTITMTVNLAKLLEFQPNQSEYFVNARDPYTVTDKFTFPSWLITGLGFDRNKNKFIVLQAPFSLGVPSSPDSEGNIKMVLAENLTISN